MKLEQVIKALEEEGFKVRVKENDPGMQVVASEGIHNVGFASYVIENEPIEWIIEKAKREIARLKEVAK